MTGQPDRDRRVLAVRCPAWRPPSLVSRQAAGRGTGPGTGPGARAFEPVVRAVQEFCPRIEVLRPGICAFAVRGPARYFGGEAELGGKIVETVTRLGLDCAVGIADGMFAALLASRDALLTARADPGRADPGRADPGRADAGRADPGRADPGRATPGPQVRIVPPGGTPAFLAPRAVTVLGEPDPADLAVPPR